MTTPAEHADRFRTRAVRARGRELDAERARLELAAALLEAYDAGIVVKPLAILSGRTPAQVRALLRVGKQHREATSG